MPHLISLPSPAPQKVLDPLEQNAALCADIYQRAMDAELNADVDAADLYRQNNWPPSRAISDFIQGLGVLLCQSHGFEAENVNDQIRFVSPAGFAPCRLRFIIRRGRKHVGYFSLNCNIDGSVELSECIKTNQQLKLFDETTELSEVSEAITVLLVVERRNVRINGEVIKRGELVVYAAVPTSRDYRRVEYKECIIIGQQLILGPSGATHGPALEDSDEVIEQVDELKEKGNEDEPGLAA